MKKILIMASILALSTSVVLAQDTTTNVSQPQKPCCQKNVKFQKPPIKDKHIKKVDFEKRLNLTEEQIAKSKELRLQSREKIKPVMEQIKAKHIELANVKKSDITEAEKQAKIDKLVKELKTLDKKAHKLRNQHMKDFEKILTKEQKKELELMKLEGRRNFAKQHPAKPFGKEFKKPCDGKCPIAPKPPVEK